VSRISDKFKELRQNGRKAFIPYICAGDPDLETTEALILALEEAGADLIELGVPFSDPMADGPAIQRASERALKRPMGLVDVLGLVERIRKRSEVPLILFTYYNPLLQFKTPNPGFVSSMRESGVDTIFLVAPTSTEERMRLIAEHSSGFIYVLALSGVTGVREHLSRQPRELVGLLRRHTRLPIAVGFGISRPEHVSEVWQYADAAVVGSRLVLEIERHLNSPKLVTEVSRLARQLTGGL
jgi:tryptophan synthase alpha chain